MSRLFLIGNGFDIDHGLPTKYTPNFKKIAERIEQRPYFWDMYQSQEADIWADFENCLAHPDFNSLEEIFDGYAPNYFSDHESDRNAIITQVDLNGNLFEALYLFADQAEQAIKEKSSKPEYRDRFNSNDLFVTFNYTHTLERVYNIPSGKVLHIHGETGKNNLLLGYPQGEYAPEEYCYDVRQKGRGPYRMVPIEEHIEEMLKDELMDCYTYKAYHSLIEKTKSFYKSPQITELRAFLRGTDVDEINVIGHSCAIDIPYFKCLNQVYPSARWVFAPFDDSTKRNVETMVKQLGIEYYDIH